MKKTFILVLLLLSSMLTFAQTKIESSIDSFTSIKLDGNLDVTLIKSDQSRFEIELQGIDSTRFEWSVDKGELQFKLRNSIIVKKDVNSEESAMLKIYYTQIETITAASSAKVLCESKIEGTTLSFNFSNKSSFSAEIEAEKVVVMAMNALITISGQTDQLAVKATAAATVNCSNLINVSAEIRTGTNAECYLMAGTSLNAKANSNSNIFYKGDPDKLTVSSSTFGAIQKY